MKTALTFILALLSCVFLPACDQLYARFRADTDTLAKRWLSPAAPILPTHISPEVIAPEHTVTTNQPAVVVLPESTNAVASTKGTLPSSPSNSVQAKKSQVPETAKASPSSVIHRPDQVYTESKLPSKQLTEVSVKSSSPAASVLPASKPVENTYPDTGSSDVYQRANSNRVILRNGDVSIDFSKDMPVINSRNSIDLNSQ